MIRKIDEHCAVVLSRSLHDGYNMAKSLQHRGKEACGLFAFGETITVVKWIGTIRTFSLDNLYQIFEGKKIYWWGFHLRYATRGRKETKDILNDAHPHVIGGRVINNGNHIIIENCDMAIIHNGQVDVKKFQHLIDASKLKTGCDSEALLHFYKEKGGREILRAIPGAYVLAIADRLSQSVIVMRDRHAVRPGVIGIKDRKYCVASENVAFLENGAHVFKDLEPGSIYHFLQDGTFNEERVIKPTKKFCMFEWNYFAHLESTLDGIPVRRVREVLGRALAEQGVPPDADFVSYLPRCPKTSAVSFFDYYKDTSGGKLESLDVFYKMKDDRSFIGSTAEERKNSIVENLFLNEACRSKINGKIGIIIDDSLIRGNNSSRAIDLLAQAGVKKIYFMPYTPPVGIRTEDYGLHGCIYGVDMPLEPPSGDEYIARDRGLNEISQIMSRRGIEVQVIYLTLANMLRAYESIGIKPEKLCYFCVGGPNI